MSSENALTSAALLTGSDPIASARGEKHALSTGKFGKRRHFSAMGLFSSPLLAFRAKIAARRKATQRRQSLCVILTQLYLSPIIHAGRVKGRIIRCVQGVVMGGSLQGGFSSLVNEYDLSINPNFLFLDSTLLRKTSHRERDGTSFFSCRGWRKDVKEIQIASLRNLKRSPEEASAARIGGQIAELARKITNGGNYRFVVPVPSGSSGRTVNFAAIVAHFVADELKTNCRNLLRGSIRGRRSTASHPKQSIRFEASCDEKEAGAGLVLLVDDVATTGMHFSRCADRLRSLGYGTVCVSWIS